MSINNLAISTNVILTGGYTGDWRAALQEAKELAIKLDTVIVVTYAGQYSWVIDKNTTLEPILAQKICIGL